MENGGYKSSYTGNLFQYKYFSVQEFEESRDYHIDLLLKHKKDKADDNFLKDLNVLLKSSISSVIPNPCTSDCSIYLKLDESAQVVIRLFDNSGKEVRLLQNKTLKAGITSIPIDSDNLKNGIYFYSININGQQIESQKVLITK